jgi:mRNA-degrading endonuclease RelE of RelBE toxin-antitoxin system
MRRMTESSYRLAFDRTLKRQVNQLPGKLRQEVRQRIADLARQPRPHDARELRGFPGVYRCWLSDARYRLIWESMTLRISSISTTSAESRTMTNCSASQSLPGSPVRLRHVA